MMRLSLLCLLAAVVHGAVDIRNEPLLGDIAEEMLLANEAGSHYGNPEDGCQADEKMFQIQGVDGDLCTPQCDEAGQCPTDVPEGVTARPLCGLKTQDGTQYCVLLCQPSELLRASAGQCGDATCRTIKGQPGVGICTYDVSNGNDIFEDVIQIE